MTTLNDTMTQLSLTITSRKIEPRDYQLQIKKQLYRLFNQDIKKVLIVAPTGAGKTVISSDIINDAVSRNRKVLFLIHRDVLAQQTAQTLQSFGLDCGFIMGSKKSNPNAIIQIASVQTLGRRQLTFTPDVIFYDEAHLTAWASSAKKLLELDCFHIGLTATPWRLKKTEGMGDIFQELIHTPLPYQLMDMGFLVSPRYFTLEKPDLKGIKIVAGDYSNSDLNRVCNVQPVIDNMIDNWLEICPNKRTIVFSVNVAHAKNIAESFRQKGISAEAVYGDMPLKERSVIYQKLENNEISVVTSCEALAEGFDVPSIECVILARPTKSKAKYFQQVGRGLRISPNKDTCFVLDQAGLIDDFGVIEDLTEVSLEHGKKKEKGTAGKCEVCGRGIPFTMKLCAKCSPEKEKTLVLGKMIELVIAKGQKRNFDFYRRKLKEAWDKGYSPGWAMYEYKKKYDEFPDIKWNLNSVFGDEPTDIHKQTYLNYLISIAQKNDKSVNWVQKYFKYQFGESYDGKISLGFVQSNLFSVS